jgi:ribosome production factor 1
MLLWNSYAFRSTEKVALQEIGPRFTLKLRSLKKGIPAVQDFGEDAKPLGFDTDEAERSKEGDEISPDALEENVTNDAKSATRKVIPPKHDEFLWTWKVHRNSLSVNSLF